MDFPSFRPVGCSADQRQPCHCRPLWMSAPLRHVRRYLCDLSELRNGTGTVAGDAKDHLDLITWRAIRPDTAAKDGPVEPLLHLLAGTTQAE